MKGLKFGIQWIVDNDNSGQDDTIEDISGYISTLLLADIFEKEPEYIAKKIYNKRNKE